MWNDRNNGCHKWRTVDPGDEALHGVNRLVEFAHTLVFVAVGLCIPQGGDKAVEFEADLVGAFFCTRELGVDAVGFGGVFFKVVHAAFDQQIDLVQACRQPGFLA